MSRGEPGERGEFAYQAHSLQPSAASTFRSFAAKPHTNRWPRGPFHFVGMIASISLSNIGRISIPFMASGSDRVRKRVHSIAI
jgi:hypothetical protein